MASSQKIQASECLSKGEEEDLRTSQDVLALQFLYVVLLEDKISKLLPSLLLKYQKQEPITQAEILQSVDDDDHEKYPVMFKAACECMHMCFGINLREVHPPGHTYIFLPVLGLTFKGILSDDYQCLSKVDLLIVTLTVIFLRDNCASEEDIKEFLRYREMLPQKDHFVVEEPWKFITEDLVQEGYVVYRQVPDSDPTRYQFLWGPRACAETTKMKVLEHLARVNKRDPRSYIYLYAQAVRDEQEASHAL